VNGIFTFEAVNQIEGTAGVRMSSSDIGDLLLHLANSNPSMLDFSSKLMPEEKYHLYA